METDRTVQHGTVRYGLLQFPVPGPVSGIPVPSRVCDKDRGVWDRELEESVAVYAARAAKCERRVASAANDASLPLQTTRRLRCQRRVVCAGHGASLSCQRRVACARHDASLAWGTTRRLALAATRRYPAQATRRLGSTPSAADGTLRAFGKEPADFNICFARPLRSLRFCNTFCHPVLAVRWQCCSKLAAMRGSY